MTIKRITRLQPQAVPSAKAGQLQAQRFPGFKQRIRQCHGIAGRMVQFETIFAGITRTADQTRDTGNRRLGEVVVFYEPQLRAGQRLDDLRRARPLHRE